MAGKGDTPRPRDEIKWQQGQEILRMGKRIEKLRAALEYVETEDEGRCGAVARDALAEDEEGE